MVNVNVQLPPLVAAPFPQSTESLQRENLRQPAIPKTEQAHAYTKMRSQQDREHAAYQSSQIIQEDATSSKQQGHSGGFNQRRYFFFAEKLKLTRPEVDQLSVELQGITDYQQVQSVIQAKYNNAVSPIPAAIINDVI